MTLMEMMITLGLLTVIFGIGADLLQDAFKVLREQNYKGQANQAIQLAFNRMCCEVREATNLNTAGSNLLELELENPNYASAVPIPYSDPYNSNNLVVVSYTTDGQGSLLRQSHLKSGGRRLPRTLFRGSRDFLVPILPTGA